MAFSVLKSGEDKIHYKNIGLYFTMGRLPKEPVNKSC